MAISTVEVGDTQTTVYTSSGSSAITLSSLCNYGPTNVTVSVHLVPNGGLPDNSNLMLVSLDIPSGDTYVMPTVGEKILLGDGDYISVVASVTSSVTSITSYISI